MNKTSIVIKSIRSVGPGTVTEITRTTNLSTPEVKAAVWGLHEAGLLEPWPAPLCTPGAEPALIWGIPA